MLAGGGALGAVQVGMLMELMADGHRPDLVIGISAGALNGAFLACDPGPGMLARMAELWRRASTREVLGLSWRSLLGLLGLRGHIADPRALRRLLDRELGDLAFEDTRVPLHLLSAELATGEGRVLSRGSVIDAILASAAIPGVFPAVEHAGCLLVDGAVSALSPLTVAQAQGATRVVILPCGFTCVGSAIPRRALGRAMHAITLLGARQLRQDYERYKDSLELHCVPPLCPLAQSAYDYSRGAELIEMARGTTRAWLAANGMAQREFPMALEPHRH